MPVLSKFYGVVVRMLFAPILGAHFHAIYGNREILVALEPLRVIQGDVPPRIRTLVLDWAVRHQAELLTAWRRCANGLRPLPIAPLP
jgi:hypothetical protein